MHAGHYGNVQWMQSVRMPLLQPGSRTDSFVTNGGGFIEGFYTLPIYYFALQQSCKRQRGVDRRVKEKKRKEKQRKKKRELYETKTSLEEGKKSSVGE